MINWLKNNLAAKVGGHRYLSGSVRNIVQTIVARVAGADDIATPSKGYPGGWGTDHPKIKKSVRKKDESIKRKLEQLFDKTEKVIRKADPEDEEKVERVVKQTIAIAEKYNAAQDRAKKAAKRTQELQAVQKSIARVERLLSKIELVQPQKAANDEALEDENDLLLMLYLAT